MFTKTVVLIMILLPLSLPVDGFASYIIHLKNGGKFITNHYWTEGNQIMFYAQGGIAGIEKNFVKAIQQSNVAYRWNPAPLNTPEQESTPSSEGQPTAPVEGGTQEDKPLLKDFHRLRSQFDGIQHMTTAELYQFDRSITDFKQKARGLAHIYDQELAQVYEMADAMEATLKERGE